MVSRKGVKGIWDLWYTWGSWEFIPVVSWTRIQWVGTSDSGIQWWEVESGAWNVVSAVNLEGYGTWNRGKWKVCRERSGVQWPSAKNTGSWHCCQYPVAEKSWLLESSGWAVRQVTGDSPAGLGLLGPGWLEDTGSEAWKIWGLVSFVHECEPPYLRHWDHLVLYREAQWLGKAGCDFGVQMRRVKGLGN